MKYILINAINELISGIEHHIDTKIHFLCHIDMTGYKDIISYNNAKALLDSNIYTNFINTYAPNSREGIIASVSLLKELNLYDTYLQHSKVISDNIHIKLSNKLCIQNEAIILHNKIRIEILKKLIEHIKTLSL